jgi:hypothetical protein
MPNFPTLPRREHLIAALVVAEIIVLTVFVFLAAQWVGKLECPPEQCKPDQTAKAISDARTALLQIIVGVAGAAALYFTWQTYVLSREGRTSDNFIKAVDQLGNDKAVHTRVGGVVGLGRLLRTATVEGDYWPLMDILTAFVRQSARIGETTPRTSKPEEDIQAAIDVIARREHKYIPERKDTLNFPSLNSPVDLSQSDLSLLWMAEGHCERGYFVESVLVRTDLTKAKLERANFDGADLSEAIFRDAEMQFSQLRGVKNAVNATFEGADLSYASFFESNLTGVSFKDAKIYNADFRRTTGFEIASAHSNSGTRLPDGVPMPDNSA